MTDAGTSHTREPGPDSLATRATLLGRLKAWEDDASWQEFFDTYWRLIYGVARRSGLSDPDAQDVVQETMLSAARTIHEFQSDPERGTFKGWLLNLTRWRIVDLIRRREPAASPNPADRSQDTRTGTVERIPDPAARDLEAVWETEWRRNLLAVATERVQRRVRPRHWQIYDLHLVRGWPAPQAARHLGVSVVAVYVTCHRLNRQLRAVLRQLEAQERERPGSSRG